MDANHDTYHVLLIGIDRYPPGYRSLSGCVNDIDAVEQLLLTPPGVSIPPEQIHIIRLAAPRAGRSYAWNSQVETLPPTKANVLQALKTLAGPDIKPSDRILIYYSGHGDEKLWDGSMIWHEAIVPHDDQKIEYLFDTEINLLISAIAKRTSDLTIVLDSCHSAGATRGDMTGIQEQESARVLGGSSFQPVEPPDLAALGVESAADDSHALSRGLLQTSTPDYLVVVACQSDEKALEGAFPEGDLPHGVFTYSLLSVLKEKDAVQRSQLRWADIWPELLAQTAERNTQLNQRRQHPWMIGRSERKVFGGRWEKMDAGYQVTGRQDGCYDIGAGRLMSVTEGTEIAVYGPQPLLFPAIGSVDDNPVGRLMVTQAQPASAIAELLGEPFVLPDGARGRVVKTGTSHRLRVSLKPYDAILADQLQKSALLKIDPSTDPDADVEVIARQEGTWIIGNEVEPVLAVIPDGQTQALRAALEHYYRYNAVLRMARNCNNPELSNSLSIQLLDCNEEAALGTMLANPLVDPDLAEAPKDHDKVYSLPRGYRFCVRVANNSNYQMNVTLFSCTSGGLVEYLSDAQIRAGAVHIMWLGNQIGVPFRAFPDKLPENSGQMSQQSFATDRVVAIGTTRLDVSLRSLAIGKTVQQVAMENLSVTRGESKSMTGHTEPSSGPVELWTAKVSPVRIARH